MQQYGQAYAVPHEVTRCMARPARVVCFMFCMQQYGQAYAVPHEVTRCVARPARVVCFVFCFVFCAGPVWPVIG